MIGKISTNICNKQRSKVADLAKYVQLQAVGTFQIIISSQNLNHFAPNSDVIFN